jgi:hypothetical protein
MRLALVAILLLVGCGSDCPEPEPARSIPECIASCGNDNPACIFECMEEL